MFTRRELETAYQSPVPSEHVNNLKGSSVERNKKEVATKQNTRENPGNPSKAILEETKEHRAPNEADDDEGEDFEESELVEIVDGIPACVGHDCDFSNTHTEILTDCTGSACPPRNDEWYQLFLGIPKPDHGYFERNWQNDQNVGGPESHEEVKRQTFEPERNSPWKRTAERSVKRAGNKFSKATLDNNDNFNRKEFPNRNVIPQTKERMTDGSVFSDEPNCRDDLCVEKLLEDDGITTSDVKNPETSIKCPTGYVKEKVGKVTFCKPRENFIERREEPEQKCEDGEKLVRTNERELCVPMKPKPFQILTCSKGQVPVPTSEGLKCADYSPEPLVVCLDGSMPIKTRSGWVCEAGQVPSEGKSDTMCPDGLVALEMVSGRYCRAGEIPIETNAGWVCPDGYNPMEMISTICMSPSPEGGQIPALDNRCKENQVALQTSAGFVCVDKVDPKPMCTPGTIPQVRHGRLECDPDPDCPAGQMAKQTETGTVCQPVTDSPPQTSPVPPVAPSGTSEPPCPYGLVPLETSVGWVCQYIPQDSKRNTVNHCPYGQFIRNKNGTVTCINNHQKDRNGCPEGQSLVRTVTGYSCRLEISESKRCPTGIFDKYGLCVPHEKSCPPGFIIIDGQCHNARVKNACPTGKELVETVNGFECLDYGHKNPGHGTKETSCENGQILSQAMRMFYCETHDVTKSEELECSPGQVFVKVGGGYACITEMEASLKCTENEVLIQLPKGFTCIPSKGSSSKKHQVPDCGPNDVQVMDENGFQKCISLDKANVKCGLGYRAVKTGQEFACRREKLNLKCPGEYILSFHNKIPACVTQTDLDCFLVEQQLAPACLEKMSKTPLPPCEDGYHLKENEGIFECTLTEECREGDQDGVGIRPCDIDPEILLAGCNPECANGGTCNTGRCFCPAGITGKACTEDVDECQFLGRSICEYQCENTFGSYQCTCPHGMTLQTDGRTCKASHCSPDCLNRGTCINGRCRCPRGFQGDFCQIDIDECELYGDRLCQHICRNTYGGYSCVCRHGNRLNTDGRTCTNTTCIPKCRNGGDCIDNKCVCAIGFYGRVCQLDINECYKYRPCSHLCVNLRGSYKCSCPEGFTLQPDGHTCHR